MRFWNKLQENHSNVNDQQEINSKKLLELIDTITSDINKFQDITTAKESMVEAKKVAEKQILDKIQDAKKDGKLYCTHMTKRKDIDLKQTDEIMGCLMAKGYDVYKNIPAVDMGIYAYYTIFWDDDSTGKHRDDDVKWVIPEK